MLTLEGLTKDFAMTRAVDSVSLTIAPGELVGVIGRSGAGKSTLLRMINRLIDPSSGKIDFVGEDVTALKGKALHAWRARCAMIFQQFNLVPRLDVMTNVLSGRFHQRPTMRNLLGLFSEEDRAAAIRALDRLDWRPSACSAPAASRAASSSASPSPARWSRTPPCCSPTSRSPRSTRATPNG